MNITVTQQARTEETWQKLDDRINADPETFHAAVTEELTLLIEDNLCPHMLRVALEGLQWRLESYVELGRVEFALVYLTRIEACLTLMEELDALAEADERSAR